MTFLQKPFIRFLFWTYLIVVLLLFVLPVGTGGGGLNNITVVSIRGDYFLHAAVLLPWAFFGPFFKQKKRLWLAAGLAIAAGSEGVQYFLPYRTFNVNDVIANMLGVVIGLVLFVLYEKLLKRIGNREACRTKL